MCVALAVLADGQDTDRKGHAQDTFLPDIAGISVTDLPPDGLACGRPAVNLDFYVQENASSIYQGTWVAGLYNVASADVYVIPNNPNPCDSITHIARLDC